MSSSWSFTNLWNSSLEQREERIMEPRDYLWASEFGNSYIDTFLKLKATPPTNPPNARSIRKFEAGNFWEVVVKHILNRAGILQDHQTRVEYQYDGLMKVTGKLDFLAGGKMDFEKARYYATTETSWLPDSFRRGVLAIINGLEKDYKDVELKQIVLEVKSCSSYMMDSYERKKTGSRAHKLQAYHYLKGTGLDEAHIVYVCKDDCRMLEIPVYAGQLEDEYKGHIQAMTMYLKKDLMPDKEKLIVFSEDTNKITTNYKVEYSMYLTELYGFAEPIEYREAIAPKVASFTRVIKRIANNDKMTEKNEEVIEEMQQYLTQDEIDKAVASVELKQEEE